MTVKEFTDYLYDAGYGSDELEFVVKGEVNHTIELYSGIRTGDYDFPMEIDHKCEFCEAYRKNGKMYVILDIKGDAT